jgi:hypothetical protein
MSFLPISLFPIRKLLRLILERSLPPGRPPAEIKRRTTQDRALRTDNANGERAFRFQRRDVVSMSYGCLPDVPARVRPLRRHLLAKVAALRKRLKRAGLRRLTQARSCHHASLSARILRVAEKVDETGDRGQRRHDQPGAQGVPFKCQASVRCLRYPNQGTFHPPQIPARARRRDRRRQGTALCRYGPLKKTPTASLSEPPMVRRCAPDLPSSPPTPRSMTGSRSTPSRRPTALTRWLFRRN